MRFRDQESEGPTQKHILVLARRHGWAAAGSSLFRPGSSRGGCWATWEHVPVERACQLFVLLSSHTPSPSHTASAPHSLSQRGVYRGTVLRVSYDQGTGPRGREEPFKVGQWVAVQKERATQRKACLASRCRSACWSAVCKEWLETLDLGGVLQVEETICVAS